MDEMKRARRKRIITQMQAEIQRIGMLMGSLESNLEARGRKR